MPVVSSSQPCSNFLTAAKVKEKWRTQPMTTACRSYLIHIIYTIKAVSITVLSPKYFSTVKNLRKMID